MNLSSEVARSLLRLDRRDAGGVAHFRFDPGLSVFEGHFPGYALVPAVFLIEAVRLASEQLLARPVSLARVERAKFTGEVRPGREIKLDVELRQAEGIQCQATCSDDGTTCATIKLVLQPHAARE
jgi:3-hydroxyacyl-[acyl-carrier-protein] dehydratase